MGSLSTLPLLSRARLKLINSLSVKKYRRREGLFVAEGVRLVEEALDAGAGISWAVVAAEEWGDLPGPRARKLLDRLLESGVPVYRAGEKELNRVLDPVQPQPVAAVCRLVPPRLDSLQLGRRCLLVVCDALREPGNLGAVVRTSAACGVAAVLAGPDTADPYSPKCVRASAGAMFRLPVVEVDSGSGITAFLESHGFTVFETAAGGENLFAAGPFPERTAVVLGSEAAGVSPAFARPAARKLAVPMAAGMESLNVAVATGVILYEIGRSSGRFRTGLRPDPKP